MREREGDIYIKSREERRRGKGGEERSEGRREGGDHPNKKINTSPLYD